MAVKRNRQLYVAGLGLALAALGLDRVLLSGDALGPDAAQASPTSAPAADVAASTTAAAKEEPDSVGLLANHLQLLEQQRSIDLANVRNAFWLEGVSSHGEVSASDHDVEQIIKKFRETHRLRTVMNSPQGAFVIVGKDRVELGGVLGVTDGARTDLFALTDIQVDAKGRRAVFNFDGRAVVLEMDSQNSAGTGGTAQDRGDASR